MRYLVVTGLFLLADASMTTAVKPGQNLTRNQRKGWDGVRTQYEEGVKAKAQGVLNRVAEIGFSSKDSFDKVMEMKGVLTANEIRELEPLKHTSSKDLFEIEAKAAPTRQYQGFGELAIKETSPYNLEQTTDYEFVVGSNVDPVFKKRVIKKEVGPFSMEATAENKIGPRALLTLRTNTGLFNIEKVKEALNSREKQAKIDAEKNKEKYDGDPMRVAWHMLGALDRDIKKHDEGLISQNFSAMEIAENMDVPAEHAEQLLWRGAAILRGAVTKPIATIAKAIFYTG